MKTFLFILILGFVVLPSVYAQSHQQKLYSGAQAYQAGEFSKAIAIYEELYDSGLANGSLLFNLGNSYFKNGQLGLGVAAYVKAFSYIPRDADLKANFDYAMSKAKDQQALQIMPHQSHKWALYNLLNHQEIVRSFAVFWILGCLLVGCSFWLSRFRRTLWSTGGIFLVLGSLMFAIGLARFYINDQLGAVTAKETEVFASPSSKNNTVVFKLHEGTLVKQIERQVDWVAIEIADQKRGWVPASSVHFF